MKYCPTCNRVSGDPETNFCWRDGDRLAEYPKCPTCHKEQAPINLYCEHCGQELKNA